MKKLLAIFSVFIISYLWLGQAGAINLLQVYNQSLTSDPVFEAARAQWMADRENIPLSRAALLPQFGATGQLTRGYNEFNYDHLAPTKRYLNTNQQLQLTLQQPLFNMQAWKALGQAHASVKASVATYTAAGQNLISRVAGAYFGVLAAKDVLRYTVAKKLAIGRQLERTKQRYKVGLVAITDVYQAQATYDSTVAQEIGNQNELANKKEALREITGQAYDYFATLRQAVPLVMPLPRNINSWVNIALKQNYGLLAARYTMLAARENISAQEFARWPTINAESQAAYNHNSNLYKTGVRDNRSIDLGLTMNFPLLQGGKVGASANQALYQYQKAVAQLEQTRRQVVSKTRQDYLGVVADISKIKADQQTVISAHSSLKATEAAYVVGTQTMVDVLNEQTKLYDAQTQLSADQYDLILKTVALKADAGILSVRDLQNINTWLQPHPKVIIKKQQPTVTAIERDFMSLNPNHYILQLTASPNKQEIMGFVNRHNISGKIYCIPEKMQGKTWYKLFVGDYPSKDQAEAAAKKMAARIKTKPWVRKLADAQK